MARNFPNAIGRQAGDIFGERVSVFTFGAKGDGSANDTAAFQNGINDLQLLGGGELYVPGGYTYSVGPLEIPASSAPITITGDGPGSVLLRRSNPAPGKGWLDIASSRVTLRNLTLDGAVTTPTGIEYSQVTDPMQSSLTNSSSIWVHAGVSDLLIQNIRITHSGGYAILLDARTGNISRVRIDACLFENNRAHLFGPPGDLNYGSWTGGIHYQSDGYNYYVEDLLVTDCVFRRNTGVPVWGHMYALNRLHRKVNILRNHVSDNGYHGLQLGGVNGGVIAGNNLRRIGYICLTDSDNPVPRFPSNFNHASAIDMAGLVLHAAIENNVVVSANGDCFDLDGLAHSVVKGNVCSVPEPGDQEYLEDSIASIGPGGSGVNWTYGMQTGNTNGLQGGDGLVISGNRFRNMGGGALRLYACRNSQISDNVIAHPANSQLPPISVGPAGSSSQLRAYNNVISRNRISWSPATVSAAIKEDNTLAAFDATDRNRVFDNEVSGNAYEFKKDSVSVSVCSLSFPTNHPGVSNVEATICQREGTGITAALKYYRNLSGVRTQVMQLTDSAFMNLSVGGGANTGAVLTGNRTTAGSLSDFCFTGKLIADGFVMLGRQTFSDAEANQFSSDYLLLRRSASGVLEKSETTSGGVRVWSPVGGSSPPFPDSTYLMQLDNGGSHFLAAYDSGFGSDQNRRAALLFRRASGTVNSPEQLTVDSNGTRLGSLSFQACVTGGGTPVFQDGSAVDSYCYSSTAGAVSADFRVTTYNAGAAVNALRISPAGQTTLGLLSAPVDARLYLDIILASRRGIAIRAAASQSANLAEYYNSSNTLIAAVGPTGAATYQALTLAVDSVTPASTTGGKYGAREIRFRQNAGEESSSGLIAHRPSFAPSALAVVGVGSSAGTRLVHIYDRVTISGADQSAALTLTDGFVSSADGYYSPSGATNVVDIPVGGVTARWLIGTRSLTLTGASSGDAGLSGSGQGRIYFDSTSNKFRVSENGGAYVDLLGGGSSSSFTGCVYVNHIDGQSYRLVPGNVSRFHGQSQGAQAVVTLDVYSSDGPNISSMLLGRRAQGSNASPGATLNGDALLILGGRGWVQGGSDWTTVISAGIFLRAVETSVGYWTATSQGSSIVFATTPSGSTSRADRVLIRDSGIVDIYGLNSVGSLRLLDGWIESDEGFYSAFSSYQTVNIPNGGLYARSLHAIVYSQVGQSYGAPSPTAGAALVAGALTWRTDLGKLQVYNGSGWVDIGGGVTSVNGTANQIIASPTTGAVVLSLPSICIMPGTLRVTNEIQNSDGVTIINSSRVFVGAGVLCGSSGIGGGAFNPWNGSGYDTGQTVTLGFNGSSLTWNGTPVSSVSFRGGVVVGASV